MAISGPKHRAADYIEGINLLTNMRLCANVPAQHAIQTALGGYQSINDLILPGGRLLEQRNNAYELLNAIPGVSTAAGPGARCTCSRSWTRKSTRSRTTSSSRLDLLKQQKILISHGRAFNWTQPGPLPSGHVAECGRLDRSRRADRGIPDRVPAVGPA